MCNYFSLFYIKFYNFYIEHIFFVRFIKKNRKQNHIRTNWFVTELHQNKIIYQKNLLDKFLNELKNLRTTDNDIFYNISLKKKKKSQCNIDFLCLNYKEKTYVFS